MKYLLLLLSVISVTAAAQTQESLFTYSYSLTVPAGLTTPYLGPPIDYDNDGVMDVAVYSHHSPYDAYVFVGMEQESVVHFGGYQSGDDPSWVWPAMDPYYVDYDNDGDMDAIGSAIWVSDKWLFLNDGFGNFTKDSKPNLPYNDLDGLEAIDTGYPEPYHPLSPRFNKSYHADLDNDGTDERIVHFHGQDPVGSNNYVKKSWVVSNGQPDPQFMSDDVLYFPIDIDLDGDMDIMDVSGGPLYINDGSGNFNLITNNVFPKNDPYTGDGTMWVGDLDNNGHLDFVFTAFHTAADYGAFLNQGNGIFSELTGSIFTNEWENQKFGDIDGDGDYDLVTKSGNELRVYENTTTNVATYIPTDAFYGDRVIVKDGDDNIVYSDQIQMQGHLHSTQPWNRKILAVGDDLTLEVNGDVPPPVDQYPHASITSTQSVYPDTDGQEGESVALTATASDDGGFPDIQWFVDGVYSGSELSITVDLSDGQHTAVFEATDSINQTTTDSVVFTVEAPQVGCSDTDYGCRLDVIESYLGL